MKTQRERAEERRTEKLAAVREQVEQGTLTIRQMTPQERAEHPPVERRPNDRRRR
jgi:hypothetical protein